MKINRQRIMPALLFLLIDAVIVTVLMYTAFAIHARVSEDTTYIDSFPVVGAGVEKERLRAQEQKRKEDIWAQEYAELPHKNYGEWTSDVLNSQAQVRAVEWKRIVWLRGNEVVNKDIRVLLLYQDQVVIGDLPAVGEVRLQEIRRMIDDAVINTVNARRIERGFPPLDIIDSETDVRLSQTNAFVAWLLVNPINLVMLIMLGILIPMVYPFFSQLKNAFSSKSISQPYKPTEETVDDIGGLPQLKALVEDFMVMLDYPRVIRSFGGDIMPGILFSGRPGTGKSKCARVLANIAFRKGIYIREIRCGRLMAVFAGAAPERIHDIFRRARKHEQALLIFNEVESFTRGRRRTLSGTEEEKSDALIEFLAEMDEVATYVANAAKDESRIRSIVVLAMTNRPELIDNALLRSERIGVHLEFPVFKTVNDRREVLEIHSRNKRLPACKKDDWLTRIAESTENFSGADLTSLLNNAARKAGIRCAKQRKGKILEEDLITFEDLEEARDTVLRKIEKEASFNREG